MWSGNGSIVFHVASRTLYQLANKRDLAVTHQKLFFYCLKFSKNHNLDLMSYTQKFENHP